ncbi:anti-sigma regulatory factor (Ser/Thr protein kinase) [Cylindrospermum stagnale PCC 7417]|uniref:Anti-sigma regulatory factor (Ser/Thr protein kinase) n=1 Tax=Cylindrospermum stagnale PCC 7417 TaxID=56107 RepID=K9X392_9NOST|nr:anti-sigma regulatory factor [Cylindrospermum stagnale]AFZ26167.1 anti-sigma regulatory factor (Ser/Thr protein kinase) [Cylindrospermum stagnale PCC 7417]
MNHPNSIWIPVKSESDLVRSIVDTKRIANEIGFDNNACQMIATAVSELSRNILKYAGKGEIIISPIQKGYRFGIEITAQDRGSGIADVEQAMADHFSSSGTLGLGLPGVKRMMDEFAINSVLEKGTRVTIKKWR